MDGNSSTHWTNTVATDADIRKNTKEEEQNRSPPRSCGVIPALQCGSLFPHRLVFASGTCVVQNCRSFFWTHELNSCRIMSRTHIFSEQQRHLRCCRGTLGGAQLSSPPCEMRGLWHISNIFVCFIVNSC